MADFRAGRVPILLATNVAARGLDVQDVDMVINYELPESAEWFTHRVGRTGRMGRSGQAITFLTVRRHGQVAPDRARAGPQAAAARSWTGTRAEAPIAHREPIPQHLVSPPAPPPRLVSQTTPG